MSTTLPFGGDISSAFNRMLFQEGVAANNTRRIPVLWESPLSRREGRSLRMVVNPNSIKFSQPKRITARDLIAGKVYYHWCDSRGKNNDVLTLSISGVTGNIDQRAINNQNKDALGNMAKLLAWSKLYTLTADPIVDPLTNKLNLVTCTIQTTLVPFPIQYTGHFLSVMDFTDDAANPFSKTWSLQFVVRTVNPPLNTIVSLLTVAFVTGADLSAMQRPLSFLG